MGCRKGKFVDCFLGYTAVNLGLASCSYYGNTLGLIYFGSNLLIDFMRLRKLLLANAILNNCL